jgi:hypothetical protein
MLALSARPSARCCATSWPASRPERTRNLLRARQLLFQLSYTPMKVPVTGSGAAQSLRPISASKRELDEACFGVHEITSRLCSSARAEEIRQSADSLHDAGVPAAHIPAAPHFVGRMLGRCAEAHPP